MRATLNDIAREVGVSRSLVSFYLVNPETTRVAEATRHKIDAAIKKLGYRRNEVAAEARTGVCKTVALLSDFSHPATSGFSAGQIIQGVLTAASVAGYGIKIYNTDDLEKSCDEILRYGIRYVLCFSFFKEYQRAVGEFCREHSLRLCYLQESCTEDASLVYSDDRKAMRELVKDFFRRGHRRFSLLKPEDEAHYSIERRRGWEEGLRDCGLEPDFRLVSSRRELDGHDRDLEEMFALPERERPTAFLCCDDHRALRTQFTALRLGRRIPEECDVAGFGNLSARSSAFPISTTVQPFQKIGAEALGIVVGSAPEPFRHLFPAAIIHYNR